MSALMALVAACKDRSCAPPPVGTGGSKPSGGGKPAGAGEAASGAEAWVTSEASFPRIFNVEMERYHNEGTYEPLTALAEYVISGYRKTNKILRDGADPSDLLTGVPVMDKAFDLYSVRLTEPITVYRGMKLLKGERQGMMERMQPGSVFEDKGFMSTAFDPEGAKTFLRTSEGMNEPIRMVINVPKGERVVAGERYENELILDRGRRMEVVGVDPPDKDGIPTVRLRVLQ